MGSWDLLVLDGKRYVDKECCVDVKGTPVFPYSECYVKINFGGYDKKELKLKVEYEDYGYLKVLGFEGVECNYPVSDEELEELRKELEPIIGETFSIDTLEFVIRTENSFSGSALEYCIPSFRALCRIPTGYPQSQEGKDLKNLFRRLRVSDTFDINRKNPIKISTDGLDYYKYDTGQF